MRSIAVRTTRVTAPVRLPITCPNYEAVPGTKRCRHYHANGACALPDEFMCVEWVKANSHRTAPSATTPAPPSPPPLTRTLFGEVRAETPARPAPIAKPPARCVAVPPIAPKPESSVSIVRTVSDAEFASFKALGLEVLLATEQVGDVWIVPEYTGTDRHELSVDHAALIAAVTSAFPGARVTALVRKPKPPVPS